MEKQDIIINEAIDKLSILTKEDFHGYRSEILNILIRVYNHIGQKQCFILQKGKKSKSNNKILYCSHCGSHHYQGANTTFK